MSLAPVALITGGARRIGAEIACTLHAAGFNIAIHCRHSLKDANTLANKLNTARANSASVFSADLINKIEIDELAKALKKKWGRLDALINSASSFYPTPLKDASEDQWDDLMGSNLKAPFFLAQAFAQSLQEARGCIINIADVHAERPLKHHAIYCAAKAGNIMLTKALARDLAPSVRVNGVAPGAIMWPESESELNADQQAEILQRIPLGRAGEPSDIARTVRFLICDAPYITGQILPVDGGRSVNT